MNLIKDCSDFLARQFTNRFKLSERESSYLDYGLQLILGYLLELVFILLIGYLLGVFWPLVVAHFCFVAFRQCAGGLHMPTYFLCFTTSLLVFIVIGLLIRFVQPGLPALFIWLFVVTLLSILLVNKYAPADTEIIPIKDPVLRKKLKKRAQPVITGWFILSLLLIYIFPAS
ncbi:MAG: accessory gene regulator B family protein, partial [Desulfobacterales bacterium]|nr:accessory gene regulator B family protein [Desulfobacterales bacterium]